MRLQIITTTITPIITEGGTITNALITTGRMVDTIAPTERQTPDYRLVSRLAINEWNGQASASLLATIIRN